MGRAEYNRHRNDEYENLLQKWKLQIRIGRIKIITERKITSYEVIAKDKESSLIQLKYKISGDNSAKGLG